MRPQAADAAAPVTLPPGPVQHTPQLGEVKEFHYIRVRSCNSLWKACTCRAASSSRAHHREY